VHPTLMILHSEWSLGGCCS